MASTGRPRAIASHVCTGVRRVSGDDLRNAEDLERAGKRLDDPDLRIAAIVLSRDLTLVTGNVCHFERVPGLRIENWLATE